ncbi:MAG: hypothetical protein MMC33_005972 [Icmadophila ericetorum]|nr:hypothetical protein [Icmadophila ericetorum]
MIFTIYLFLGLGLAQRPSNVSICDYYATSKYGTNSSDTQLQLIQSIVALAFGGSFNLSQYSVTGILNQGTFQTTTVDLRQFFNGSIQSSNLNNQPVAIDWLNGGALDPLYSFLSNETSDIIISDLTNQGKLFANFLYSFSEMFGCTMGPTSPSNNEVALAYVHKFMNLNWIQIDLGYFIQELSTATTQVGFSDEDSATLATSLNSLYNVRCAPPVSTNGGPPELLSLCQASNCPLAEPNPDCDAYVNLTSNGIPPDITATVLGITTSSTSAPTSTSTSSTIASPSPSPTATAAAAPSNNAALTAGAIAGIAIGAAALVTLFFIILIFSRRRRSLYQNPDTVRQHPENQTQYSSPNHPYPNTGGGYNYQPGTTGTPLKPRQSLAEMDSPEMTQRSPTFPSTQLSETQRVITPDPDGNPAHGSRVGSPELGTRNSAAEMLRPPGEAPTDAERREKFWGRSTTTG